MSTPGEFYRSLPPVSKFYGVACLMTTSALYLGLYNLKNIALFYEDVFKHFQVWRLITNFFFLGPFSVPFAVRLILIAKYGVSLERGPFDKRTADYIWMFIFGALSLLVMCAIPMLWSPFNGGSIVYMILYVWGRELPNARVTFYNLVTLKGFYLPWTMLVLDLLFGIPLKTGIRGIIAGHLYYFLTVLHPLSGGKFMLKTPLWVHKLVARWGEGVQLNSPVQQDPNAGVAFTGRSFRLSGTRTQTSTPPGQSQTSSTDSAEQPGSGEGVAFRGRSYRLDGHPATPNYTPPLLRKSLRYQRGVGSSGKEWFTVSSMSWGRDKMLSLDDLNDPSKGYLVNDTLTVEATVDFTARVKHL
ncbi:hypothetical protein SLE2022_370640 [Rubroshorea leprosula]